jgi:hypothetical protein
MSVEIELRRDSAANWAAANPVLAAGEPAVEYSTSPSVAPKLKIGDGVTPYESLPYELDGVTVSKAAILALGITPAELSADPAGAAAAAVAALNLGTASTHAVTDFDTAGAAATEATRAETAEARALVKTNNLNDLSSLTSAIANIGSTIILGSGAPSSSVGVAGQFYWDTAGEALYGPMEIMGSSVGAFPTTSILDNTTRANETPLSDGGNWGGPWYSNQVLPNLTGNEIVANGNSSALWLPISAADCEVYFTIASGFVDNSTGGIYLVWRATNPGASNNGYYTKIYNGTSFPHKVVNGGTSGLATSTITVNAGDSFGVRMLGSTITFYRKPSGGSWASFSTLTDTSLTGPGMVGIMIDSGATSAVTNVGGGAAVYSGGSLNWPSVPVVRGSQGGNVFVQSSTPTVPSSGQALWFETDSNNNLIDVLIGGAA